MRCQLPFLRVSFAAASLLCVLLSGCQTFNAELNSLFGQEPQAAPAQVAADPNGQKYYVEFRGDGQKPILVPYPLADAMVIQQALDRSNAFKKYRRAKIELYRQLPGGGGHKLPIEYDRGQRKIPPACDYALHPNDRIVVTEDTSTVLDDMLDSLGAKQLKGK